MSQENPENRLRKIVEAYADVIAPLAKESIIEAADALAASRERLAAVEGERDRLQSTVNFLVSMAWRTDPPNANNKLTDAERLSAIKFHPVVKKFAQPHIDLAAEEARDALAKEQGE